MPALCFLSFTFIFSEHSFCRKHSFDAFVFCNCFPERPPEGLEYGLCFVVQIAPVKEIHVDAYLGFVDKTLKKLFYHIGIKIHRSSL